MKKVELKAWLREKRNPKQLRKEGIIPAILYGGHKEPTPLQVLKNEFVHFLHAIHGEKTLINLLIKKDGKEKSELAIIKDMQLDPLTDEIIHIDFQRISLKEKITAEVPVIYVGEPEGVKKGGVLEHILRSIEVEALPEDLPEHIEVDVSSLDIGDSFHVGDISLPEKIKILTPLEETIFTVLAPKVTEEIVEVEEVEVAEEEKIEEEEEKKEKEEEE